MKKLSCTDIDPKSECHYMSTGETASAVVEDMMVHAKEAHADELREMNMSDAEIKLLFESKVHDC